MTKLLEDLIFFVADVLNNGQEVLDVVITKPNRERQKLMREQNILAQVDTFAYFIFLNGSIKKVLVIVICCCVTNSPKVTENNRYLSHSFCGLGVWEWFSLAVLAQDLSQGYFQGVGWGCSHLKAFMGEDSLSWASPQDGPHSSAVCFP